MLTIGLQTNISTNLPLERPHVTTAASSNLSANKSSPHCSVRYCVRYLRRPKGISNTKFSLGEVIPIISFHIDAFSSHRSISQPMLCLHTCICTRNTNFLQSKACMHVCMNVFNHIGEIQSFAQGLSFVCIEEKRCPNSNA